MPYNSNSDLPQNITKHLPEHAQSIFRKAFNHALEEYGDEVRAFKTAWAAVKHEYVKGNDGMWIKKDGLENLK